MEKNSENNWVDGDKSFEFGPIFSIFIKNSRISITKKKTGEAMKKYEGQ